MNWIIKAFRQFDLQSAVPYDTHTEPLFPNFNVMRIANAYEHRLLCSCLFLSQEFISCLCNLSHLKKCDSSIHIRRREFWNVSHLRTNYGLHSTAHDLPRLLNKFIIDRINIRCLTKNKTMYARVLFRKIIPYSFFFFIIITIPCKCRGTRPGQATLWKLFVLWNKQVQVQIKLWLFASYGGSICPNCMRANSTYNTGDTKWFRRYLN